MMWAFGQEKDPMKVKGLMTTNISNELSARRALEEVED
jgi:hypothetical protein